MAQPPMSPNSHFSHFKMTLPEWPVWTDTSVSPVQCTETHALCKNEAGTLRVEVGNADLLSVQITYRFRLNTPDSSFRADIWEETSSNLLRFLTIGPMVNLPLEGWVESIFLPNIVKLYL